MLMVFLFVLLTFVPLSIFGALLGWVLIFSEIIIAIIALIAAALLLPLLSQWLLKKTGRRLPVAPIALLILVLEVVFVWHKFTTPIDIGLPEREEVAAVHIQNIENYDSAWERIDRELTLPTTDMGGLLDQLYTLPYKLDLRIKWPWQQSVKQEFDEIFKVELQNESGEVLKTIHIYDELTVRPLSEKGKERKYRMDDEQPLDIGIIYDEFSAQKRIGIQAKWQDYMDTLIGSLTYTDDPGELAFTIPESRPDGTFYLMLEARGMADYDPNGKYEPTDLKIYTEEQKKQNWEPGKTYYLTLGDSVFEYNRLELHLEGQKFTFDLLSFADARYTYKK